MATINVTTKILAFSDLGEVTSNPRLKHVDWLRDMTGMPANDPQSLVYTLAPGTSKEVYNGTVASTVDGTTAFDLSLSTLGASRYRLTHSSGTNPGFRVGRNLLLNGVTLTFTVNSNGTVSLSIPAGPDFASVVVGDSVFIPHTTTGDASSPVSVLNAGYWEVLGKLSSTSIVLVRPASQDFEGTSQVVALTNSNQIRAYSAAGLQSGDSVDISAGFSVPARKTFSIDTVTDSFIEFISTSPLAAQSGIIPGAAGIGFFSSNKSFVYVEANQECVVRVNGDTGNFQRLSPPDASNASWPAQYMRRGPTWSLTLVNLSSKTLTATVIHSE